ncbi:MAG: CoA transferase [Chloroflexi bacterium]|nr:CoA transferase [Chloroflexota bacterium]
MPEEPNSAMLPKQDGPLSGIRVLEWGIMQQGPVVGVMLGDLGAEVIKIEQRGVGDPGRVVKRIHGAALVPLKGGRCYYFETFNRNKKSIAIDLSKPRGKEIIYRLIKKTDVFVENFRNSAAVKLGMDYETLSRHNPRLVYGAASGWGPEGPEAERPGYAATAQARSGFMLNIGEANMPPVSGPYGMADQVGGSYLAYGIVAALFARERTGLGQKVDASLLGGMIWLQQGEVSYGLLGGGTRRPVREKAANVMSNRYRCADDRWICFAMAQADRYWHEFCQTLQLGSLENDPRFSDAEKRRQNGPELVGILDKVMAGKTLAEWMKILEGTDLVYAPVNSPADLVNDRQAILNNYITELDHAGLGNIRVVGPPVSFSRSDARPRSGAPECGQHTEEVLLEMGGYTWDEISQLKEEEVI